MIWAEIFGGLIINIMAWTLFILFWRRRSPQEPTDLAVSLCAILASGIGVGLFALGIAAASHA